MTFKVQPLLLLSTSPLAMALIPPDIAVTMLIGAWLAVAFFMKSREGIPAPNEHLGWRRVVADALGINVSFLIGLIYVFRQRTAYLPAAVLAVGLLLAFGLVLCYLHAMAWDIPRKLRVAHGYLVGLTAFVPWVVIMARSGWTVFVLGFFSFLFLPPFFLATLDLKLRLPHRRRRHRRVRGPGFIRLPHR